MSEFRFSEVDVRSALHTIEHSSADDASFVQQLSLYLANVKKAYDENRNSDWVKGATFSAQQLSRTWRLARKGTKNIPLLLNFTPTKATFAVSAVMAEKVAFAVGISSNDQMTKCASAAVALAANTTAAFVLVAGTGGISLLLTVASLASSMATAYGECRAVGAKSL